MIDQFEFSINDPRKPRPVLEPPNENEQRLIDEWLRFKKANPQVDYVIIAIFLEKFRHFDHYRIGAVFEDMRDIRWLRTSDPIYKLSHNHRAFYARWFLYHYPEFSECIELNTSAADKVDYSLVD